MKLIGQPKIAFQQQIISHLAATKLAGQTKDDRTQQEASNVQIPISKSVVANRVENKESRSETDLNSSNDARRVFSAKPKTEAISDATVQSIHPAKKGSKVEILNSLESQPDSKLGNLRELTKPQRLVETKDKISNMTEEATAKKDKAASSIGQGNETGAITKLDVLEAKAADTKPDLGYKNAQSMTNRAATNVSQGAKSARPKPFSNASEPAAPKVNQTTRSAALEPVNSASEPAASRLDQTANAAPLAAEQSKEQADGVIAASPTKNSDPKEELVAEQTAHSADYSSNKGDNKSVGASDQSGRPVKISHAQEVKHDQGKQAEQTGGIFSTVRNMFKRMF